VRRWLRIGFLILGSALFLYLLLDLGPPRILGLLLEIGWGFAAIAAIYAAHQLLRIFAFWLCARTYAPVAYRQLVRIRFAGEAIQYLTFTGLFLSVPAQAMLLRQARMSGTQAFAATAIDYILYYILTAAMTLAALSYLLAERGIAGAFAAGARIAAWAAGAFLAAATFAIARRAYLIGGILNGLARLPGIGKRLRIDPSALRRTEDLLFVVLRNPRRFSSILAAQAAAQVPLILELFILLRLTGQEFAVADLVLIEAATKFLGTAFFFVPGQVGASEGVYVVVFQAAGLAAASGFSLALARRLRSLLVAAIGMAALARGSKGDGA
jgi:hypothetical protein